MKKTILIFCLALLSMAAHCGQRKALFVIIDGIPADCIERLQPPTLMDIARQGLFCPAIAGGETDTYSETPTISAIGYTNVLTGTWMNKHNVRGNDHIKANYHYPTIFRIAKDQARPVTTAIYSSWTDNRTILLGEGLEATGKLKVDFTYDGYDLDTIRFPKQPDEKHIQAIDGQVCHDAANCIAKNAPDLNWLYLWYTDDAFHIHGNGVKADSAVMVVDRQLADVWKAVKQRQREKGEEWLVIITTDHGRDLSGYSHGGQSVRERESWIVTNTKAVNKHFSMGRLSQVDICPTLCTFMGFKVPTAVRYEMDGVPFIGNIDIDDLKVMPYDQSADLEWKAINPSAHVDIYMSGTNRFSEGGSDDWKLVGSTEAGKEKMRIDLSKYPKSKFHKFAVVTANSVLTKWMMQ